jgi:hypothetical protein
MLDRLRGSFVYIVALLLPLAGFLLAAARFVEHEGDEGTRLAAVSLLGASIYLLLFFG